METPKRVPEWDIFDRIEKLEKLSPTFKTLKELAPTTKDAYTMAQMAFLLGFYALARHSSNCRKLKDVWVAHLKKQGLSTEALEQIEKWLIRVCEVLEEP